MAFDPTEFGATPVDPSTPVSKPDFNPAEFGATEVAPEQSFRQKALGVIGGLVKDIETPFVSLAATPFQAAVKGYNALTGSNVADPFANGVPSVAGGNTPVAPLTGAGLLQKAGQAGDIGALAIAPEAGILKTAGVGALAGGSQSLAQGNTDAEQVLKDAVVGSLFAGSLGMAGNTLGLGAKVLKGGAGITPQMANEIQSASPSLIAHYIDTTEGHVQNIRIPSPDTVADKAFEARANILIDTIIPQAGKAIDAAKKNFPGVQIALPGPVEGTMLSGKATAQSVLQNFEKRVSDVTGHAFGEIKPDSLALLDAHTPVLTPQTGRSIVLSESDKEDLLAAQQYIKRLTQKPNAQIASDIINNLDEMIGKKWDTKSFGGKDPIAVSLLKQARGMVNETLKTGSPELAKANATYSALMDLRSQIGKAAGQELQSGSLLMRRVMSGDKGGDAVSLLDNLSRITQPFIPAAKAELPEYQGNLVQHAILSEFAKKNFGDASTQTLMRQYQDHGPNLIESTSNMIGTGVKTLVSHVTPSTREYAMNLAGAPSDSKVAKIVDQVVNNKTTKPTLDAIGNFMKSQGVSPEHIPTVAKKLLKLMVFQRMTAPTPPAPNAQMTSDVPAVSSDQGQLPFQLSTNSSIPSSNTTQNLSAIRQLSGPQNGAQMSRSLNQPTTGLNLSSSLTQ